MPYDSITNRDDAEALMPEEVSNDFLKGINAQSAVLQTFTRLSPGRKQTRMPVLSALPVAYWVNGDTGLKQTTQAAWANKYLNVEDLAVIVPIPENVVADSGEPIWDKIQPLCEQAGARLIDQTVYFGDGSPPDSFPDDIVTAAAAVGSGDGNVIEEGTTAAEDGGLAGDHSALLTLLETQGFAPTSGVAARAFRGKARQARNANGDRFAEISIDKDGVEIDGVRYDTNSMPGLWPAGNSAAQAIAIDREQFVVGVRQDISWKLLDQAVIQGPDGSIVYNLAQQDMVAMRMVMRLGWQVANTINYEQEDEDERYPAAVLTTPAS